MVKRKSALFTRVKKRASTSTPRSSQPTPTSLSHSAPRQQQRSPQSSPTLSLSHAPSSPRTQRQHAPVASRKRKRPSPFSSPPPVETDLDSDADADELSKSRFPQLQPRERFVNQSVVKSRWEPLPRAAQDKVLEIFHAVERPLIAAQKGERERTEAQTVLGQVLRTLGRRLPRMPFPPGAGSGTGTGAVGANGFDGEGVLRGTRALEQQLTPARHSVAMLREEIRRENERLEQDQQDLEGLKRNAKSEDKALKRTVAKSHHLLEQISEWDIEDGPEDINLRHQSLEGELIDDNKLDPSLEPLARQIRNHIESMEGNYAQVEGVSEQIEASKLKIDAVLFERLHSENYQGLPAL